MRAGLLLVLCLSVSCMESRTLDGDSASTIPGECGPFGACGGDPVGEWDLVSMCLNDLQAVVSSMVDAPECGDGLHGVDYNVTGSFVMDASGSAMTEISASIDVDAVLTQACVTALGGPQLSAAVCAMREDAIVQTPDSPYEGAACTYSPGQCRCLATSMTITDSSSDTLTQEGNTLVDSTGETASFCVTGDTLELASPPSIGSGVLTFKRRY